MDRQEAKSLLPIIKAFSEWKTIQFNVNGVWADLIVENINFNLSPDNYRIKPEPKYRPFANAEECWQEMQKHQPFGWVYEKECPPPKDGVYMLLDTIGYQVKLSESSAENFMDYADMFDDFAFADGQPFGIKEEEK